MKSYPLNFGKDSMNKQKLENYNLTGSIHTLSVKSPGIVEDIQKEVSNCITANSQTKNNQPTTTSIINPNKLVGDVFAYSEFETVFNTILAGAGIKNYNIVRADMRFDNYDPEHYRAYAKLNRYLISALAVTYKVKNAYRTANLFNQQQLSVAIKNDYFECENYDRAAKSEITENKTEPAQSRLEERTTSRQWRRINEKAKLEELEIVSDWNIYALKREFTDGWFERWDNAIKNLDLVQQTYNDELEKLYNADKNSYPCRFRSMTDFILQYQDCIFTRKQLIDLFTRLGVENPIRRAKNHKQRYGIEFFSKADVQRAIDEVKRATKDFFEQ